MELLMEQLGESPSQEYFRVISLCRVGYLLLNCKAAQLKLQQSKQKQLQMSQFLTDSLPLGKSKHQALFRKFWTKFIHVGQPWNQ
eukprot:CAMPEP_0202976840 /NCGR_PEP_ID=MMETSP1396-20130829/80960_1 /ASSEMBLY_ACC=CAM_ASM_000872 /TAXON_ID= /ORGANISM="Pseudokeronopsis sp., Strain Brazil" /LENGTH=84 /DNA_ID=CAMNT_0049714879 /DNA_START=127 /DNA_END=378 /DNA_ORIENTATION=+